MSSSDSGCRQGRPNVGGPARDLNGSFTIPAEDANPPSACPGEVDAGSPTRTRAKGIQQPAGRPRRMFVDSTGTQSAAVIGAIRNAARATGADFQYLLATAQAESALNPTASVSNSSARGLFQFIDQTWLSTLKQSGPALGYRSEERRVGKECRSRW